MNASEIAVKLGFSPDTKMLIIHCDDIGMSWGANKAAKELLIQGVPKSASVMLPCPWSYEFACWYRQHSELDVGVHITLTSEWKTYRWKPLTSKELVPRLTDQTGFMYRSVAEVAKNATAEEVYKEICQQIEQALSWGITPTHIDTHMGTVFARIDFAKAYLRAAATYNIFPMIVEPSPLVLSMMEKSFVSQELADLLAKAPTPKVSAVISAAAGETYEEKKRAVYRQLETLPAGLSYFIIHPNVYTPEMPDITESAQQRDWEYKIFMEEETAKKIEELEIQIITWQQIARAIHV